jgi:hypothetical protein
MTLHLMFLFLHNMAGEDTGHGENRAYVSKEEIATSPLSILGNEGD